MIKLTTKPASDPLFGKSKWWGQPDMPEDMQYPELMVDDDGIVYDDPLTFISQIRCEDIAPYDKEGILPREGMLYFFASLDYFLGASESLAYPGMGEWHPQYFRVLYAPHCDNLHTHRILYDDGREVGLPAEAIDFSPCEQDEDGTRLLGQPYIDEVRENMPHTISLLQIDEDDRWNLIFHDCGMVNFLITKEDLQKQRFDKAKCYLYSF